MPQRLKVCYQPLTFEDLILRQFFVDKKGILCCTEKVDPEDVNVYVAKCHISVPQQKQSELQIDNNSFLYMLYFVCVCVSVALRVSLLIKSWLVKKLQQYIWDVAALKAKLLGFMFGLALFLQQKRKKNTLLALFLRQTKFFLA